MCRREWEQKGGEVLQLSEKTEENDEKGKTVEKLFLTSSQELKSSISDGVQLECATNADFWSGAERMSGEQANNVCPRNCEDLRVPRHAQIGYELIVGIYLGVTGMQFLMTVFSAGCQDTTFG